PPTTAAAPGTACTAFRSWFTTSTAAGESAGTVSVASSRTRPFTTNAGPFGTGRPEYGSTAATPGTSLAASTTSFRAPALAMISAGLPALDAAAVLSIENGIRVSPRARPTSTSTVDAQTTRERRPTRPASRVQIPGRSGRSDPYCGMDGQNADRPNSTSNAGNRVSMASSAQAMPMAPIGPRPRLDARSETS